MSPITKIEPITESVDITTKIEQYRQEVERLKQQESKLQWELQQLQQELQTNESEILKYYPDFPIDADPLIKMEYLNRIAEQLQQNLDELLKNKTSI